MRFRTACCSAHLNSVQFGKSTCLMQVTLQEHTAGIAAEMDFSSSVRLIDTLYSNRRQHAKNPGIRAVQMEIAGPLSNNGKGADIVSKSAEIKYRPFPASCFCCKGAKRSPLLPGAWLRIKGGMHHH
jgi:hypothetical protein